ncbi:FliA/WhiG family RNA polymerase sigma factor [Virgibacillus sp. NKC19-16]|uniref:FliA/WhiG family RNA polymerase sigma factor n=1 Tax=Virgibacillus salidurans TaxID=2831673 RepID=UPI001F3D0E0A|nr:FliA/WhiG family RNA polymerase sigma factor [Virgibacillus sp. NKC19-16]UJL47956.1 FliA/WhiG family RNA polymerase sigma factor [Virgibacillus sp. NKC19-16]
MTTNKSPLEQKLWDKWILTKDRDTANDLIQNYIYLVSFHVDRISSHLPNNVSKDDMKSFGLMGLYDALKKFEPARDLKFDTYAAFRVRGAIIDGLRKEDWLPRSLREKTKKIEQVTGELEQTYQRLPTAEEIAKRTGMLTKEVEEIIKDSLFAHVLSIEEKPRDGRSELKEGLGYTIADEATISPEENMLAIEVKKELAEGIKLLNDNEQMVISLFYHDELTLTEIGNVLGLTTSRISQIHKKAIFKLRKALKKIQALS